MKNEDRNNADKVIFNLRLDREERSQPCRVFSKIFKLDENNQYGFVMTKPQPVWTFKKKTFFNLNILNKVVNDFDPSNKIGHIFVVNIHSRT